MCRGGQRRHFVKNNNYFVRYFKDHALQELRDTTGVKINKVKDNLARCFTDKFT
jgi:hypothetical protein